MEKWGWPVSHDAVLSTRAGRGRKYVASSVLRRLVTRVSCTRAVYSSIHNLANASVPRRDVSPCGPSTKASAVSPIMRCAARRLRAWLSLTTCLPPPTFSLKRPLLLHAQLAFVCASALAQQRLCAQTETRTEAQSATPVPAVVRRSRLPLPRARFRRRCHRTWPGREV